MNEPECTPSIATGKQATFVGINGGQAPAAQGPVPSTAAGVAQALPLTAAQIGDRLLGMNLQSLPPPQVPIKETQLQAIESPAPVQVAPGTDPHPGVSARGAATGQQIQHPHQVRIMPAPHQQHRLAEEGFGRLMPPPALGLARIQP